MSRWKSRYDKLSDMSYMAQELIPCRNCEIPFYRVFNGPYYCPDCMKTIQYGIRDEHRTRSSS